VLSICRFPISAPERAHVNVMDLATIEVVLLNGKKLSLEESLEQVVQALMSDGCVLLRRATDLAPVEPIL
jgi:hypothetical protein